MTVTISTPAKQAHANRLAGGSDLLQAKYLVMFDSAGIAVQTLANNTAVTVPSGALTTVVAAGTATCPAGVATPIIGGYVIGDVGAYHIDSVADAVALCAAAPTAILPYIIATIALVGAPPGGEQIAVTAADIVQLSCTLSF